MGGAPQNLVAPWGVLAVHYEIRGRVLQQTDRTPLAGLRVEGWDADLRGGAEFPRLSDHGTPTASSSSSSTSRAIASWIGDHDPDIYFRVYRCRRT